MRDRGNLDRTVELQHGKLFWYNDQNCAIGTRGSSTRTRAFSTLESSLSEYNVHSTASLHQGKWLHRQGHSKRIPKKRKWRQKQTCKGSRGFTHFIRHTPILSNKYRAMPQKTERWQNFPGGRVPSGAKKYTQENWEFRTWPFLCFIQISHIHKCIGTPMAIRKPLWAIFSKLVFPLRAHY